MAPAVAAGAGILGAGYSIYSGERAAQAAKDARARAEKEAREQATKERAKMEAQERMIAEKKAKQDKVAKEREERMKQKQLLSGGETGIAAGEELAGSLLA